MMIPTPITTTSGYIAIRAHQHRAHGGNAITSLKNKLPTTDENAKNHAAYGSMSLKPDDRFSISFKFTKFAFNWLFAALKSL